jgi:hypothetical protein
MTRSRSPWSSKRSSGTSTLAQRDQAARAIAERVDRWHRETERATTGKASTAALEQLGRDLGPLADRYREADRTHQSLTVDSLAVADGAALLERLHKAPWDSPQRKRVEAAAMRWLTSPAQRVRMSLDGSPVVLRLVGESLYGSRDGRAAWVGIEEALRAPRAQTFEPCVGPELPPRGDADRCHCEQEHDLADCPDAKPCEGGWAEGRRLPGCGRLTNHGYACRFCSNPRWEAAAWIVRAVPTVPLAAGFVVPPPMMTAREGAGHGLDDDRRKRREARS